MGHIAAECKKGKAKALITSSKSWMDSSDSEEEEVNYALMASIEDNATPDTKVPNTIFDFDTDNVSELRLFLKSLHISFKSQSLENARILSELSEVRKRNNQVEAELLCMKEVQIECDKTKHMNTVIQKKYESLEKELASERAIINKWQNSGKNSSRMFEGNNWRRGLGYDETVETSNQ
jgi:hypothetical protein